jgi:hypothetical protein
MSFDADLADLVRRAVEPLAVEVREARAELRALRESLPPNLMRPEEVERRYGYPRSTQRRHVAEGRLKVTKIGRLTLIDVSQLQPLGADEIAQMAARARASR